MWLIKMFLRTGIVLFLLSYFFPLVSYLNWTTLFFASFILTLLQLIVQPVLKLLFLPINLVTFGLFSWVINVFVLWLAIFLVPGFEVHSFQVGNLAVAGIWALIAISWLISVLQALISKII